MFHVKRLFARLRLSWTRLVAESDNVVSDEPVNDTVPITSEMSEPMVTTSVLVDIRSRIVPMMEVAATQYRHRVPAGYPNVVDQPDRGVVGLEIDPDFALYITAEGDEVYAEVYRRAPRTDNRAGGGRQKFAGTPFNDRRLLDPQISDQGLRNLIAELMSYFNFQPGLIHITDD